MNKQELLNRIDELPSNLICNRVAVDKSSVVELVKLLDEHPKIKIPQFVAWWIERCKHEGYVLRYALQEAPEGVVKWLNDGSGDHSFRIFARAWLDGYEVDKKKYQVRSGRSYFSQFDEVRVVAVLDDMPGYEDYVKYFDSLEEAQKVAGQLGWEAEEVEKMKRELSMEYIDEQIELWGEIEEYDDGISYCPYCGYANELDCEDYEETHDQERECYECEKFYLESIEIDVRRYTKTKRLKVKGD